MRGTEIFNDTLEHLIEGTLDECCEDSGVKDVLLLDFAFAVTKLDVLCRIWRIIL